MKISQLVSKLILINEKFGDIDVVTESDSGSVQYSIEKVELELNKETYDVEVVVLKSV